MMLRRTFLLAVAAVFTATLQAQDDAYAHVTFTNESKSAVKLKVWNPRASGAKFESSVEAGKSVEITNAEGKPARVGLISSQIQVNEQAAVSVMSVAKRDGEKHVVTWTDSGFAATR